MINKIIKIARNFYLYQEDRFPIIILTFSLLPAILSSGAITSSHLTIFRVVLVLLASIAYLLHIRIIDEYRDFSHDNMHHITRPVQAGVISKGELFYVDILAVSILLAVAVTAGLFSFIISIIMLGYSYFAGKEFFIGEKLRNHFFIYNSVNLIQMFLMQVFVYTVFTNSLLLNNLILAHFLFTSVGTIIFEFVRKLKIPGDDGSGRDTYTWYLGFSKSIIVHQALLVLDTALFFWIITIISSNNILLYFGLTLTILTSFSTLIHRIKKTHKTDQLMQLSFLLLYMIFNVSIYFLAIN